jgi:phenylacetate-CoA ligase
MINLVNNLKRKRIKRYLTLSKPDALIKGLPYQVLSSFRHAARNCPAYHKILDSHGIIAESINTLDEFKQKVPVIDKNSFFSAFPFIEITGKKNFDNIRYVMASSGFSGKFAYGVDLKKNSKNSSFFVDTALDLFFKTSKRKTFLINCTPMGVHVETSLPLAETSVRSDMVLALLNRVSPYYEQTIIIGDPYFLKKTIEEGCETGINWKKLNVSLVLGQDWFPESLRSYLGSLMEIDLDKDTDRLIIATMGLTELGLNVFHESPETIKIRRYAQANATFHEKLFRTNSKASGFLFHYYPMRFYIEENHQGLLAFTTLSKSVSIPLIRYTSGDCGHPFSYSGLTELLSDFHIEHLSPLLKLPLSTITGRAGNYMQIKDKIICPEDLKLGLYENFEIASRITGHFVLVAENNIPIVHIQLKPSIKPELTLNNVIKNAIAKYTDADIIIKSYTYSEYPYAMELNYERKFSNIL